ncbi:TPA: fimbrial protein [Yersinia enterocolitica]|nr:fimbrial protein [Yersinia enterocolitica]
MNRILTLTVLLITQILFIGGVLANNNAMLFKGTLIEPPNCIINNGQTLDVNFGDELMTSRVDGKNYLKQVKHSLKCKNPALNNMKMRIVGESASFDDTSLQTDNENLAIKILVNKKHISVNEWVNFTYDNNFGVYRLDVVPVKSPAATLKGGSFLATGILMVDYQ